MSSLMRPLTSPLLIFSPLSFLFQYNTLVVLWPCVFPSNNPLLCLVYTQNPVTIGNYLIYFSVSGQHTVSTRGNTNKPLFFITLGFCEGSLITLSHWVVRIPASSAGHVLSNTGSAWPSSWHSARKLSPTLLPLQN